MDTVNREEESESNEEDYSDVEHISDDEDNDSIQLANGFSGNKKSKTTLKLEKMFKPKMKKDKQINKPKVEKKALSEEEKKYKVNSKLQEMIKENQRLCSLIKKEDDINLIVSTIRKYYSYQCLEFVKKSFSVQNKGYSSNLLFNNHHEETTFDNDQIRVFEGTNEVQIYDKINMKLVKKHVPLDKKKHGTNIFLDGCRTFFQQDRLYITGGKDKKGVDNNLFLMYNVKDGTVTKLSPMNKERSYHTMTFHENLKSIMVVGGENNKFSEMYDFYLKAWNELPELNVPRANISVHIDKIGTMAYAVGGQIGNISSSQNSDAIELLDLVEIIQCWAKVEYNNKACVDLKFSNNGVYSLTDDKLLIYGGLENRGIKKCYVVFDLRTFDILPISVQTLEQLKVQSARNPEMKDIFD